MHSQFKTFDRFYPQAKTLRAHFDGRFKNPLHAHGARFVWDFWHVPEQYTVLRTPAYQYFPPAMYAAFHRRLVLWGRERLGCHDVSPPWLSCYVEGCRQEPHRDVPHGPLAFVYSLTRWQGRKFHGGETFLFESNRRRKLIEPKFNRLTIFNPAILHGVREVKGTRDPREGRLVIQGWFVNPRPFWYGPLSATQVQDGIENSLPAILRSGWNLGRGFASFRLRIGREGNVERSEILMSTLNHGSVADLLALNRKLMTLTFARRRASSVLTLPLTVE